MTRIAIIGGGASGMFLAANLKNANADVSVFERSQDILEKLKLTGGGRCNLTNAEFDVEKFVKNYPRGAKRLRNLFRFFGSKDTMNWFESRGLHLKIEDEKRVFPSSNLSSDVAKVLEKCALENGAKISRNIGIESIKLQDDFTFKLENSFGRKDIFDVVIFARGGRWSKSLQQNLENLNIKFTRQEASLFGFKSAISKEFDLSGVALKNAHLISKQFNFESEGGFLFTHEGISGPCVLKMSSLGAYEFCDCNYCTDFVLNLAKNPESISNFIKLARQKEAKKLVKNFWYSEIPQKLWITILKFANINPESTWAEFSKESQKNLISKMQNFEIKTLGKAVNSSEFVCAGGVDLNCIDLKTMQSKDVKNLYFIGECLDIDAFTGGFNLQAAWSSAFVASKAIEKSLM